MEKSKEYIGKSFCQENLLTNLQNQGFGQSTLHKSIIFIISCLLLLISTSLGAVLISSLAIGSIFYRSEIQIYMAFCLLISSFLWISIAAKSRFRNGLYAFGVSLLISWISLLPIRLIYPSFWETIEGAEDFIGTLITLPLLIVFFTLSFWVSFLLMVYSRALNFFLFLRYTKRFYIVEIIIIIVSIVVSASLSISSYRETDGSLEDLEGRLKPSRYTEFLRSVISILGEQEQFLFLIGVLFGIIFCSMLLLVSFDVVDVRGIKNNHFKFLKSWVINLTCWRGTSFHDLDISGVDFQDSTLANVDLRARVLCKTKFKGADGLDKAKVDNSYLDLENPKVRELLTRHTCSDRDLSKLVLRGACLQEIDLRKVNLAGVTLTDADLSGADLRDCVLAFTQLENADLSGADLRKTNFTNANLASTNLQGADLRGAILVRAQLMQANLTGADLTGTCIQDWSINENTRFANVLCDYIYRGLDEDGKPNERQPPDRDFDPHEFEPIYQEIANVAELIFKEGVNWRAFGFSLQKLDLEDEGLGLQLKGFEKRGDRWVVKITHNPDIATPEVERRLLERYEEMKRLLASKEDQINKLLDITKELSKKPFGNNFFIVGSSITNLTGSGQIIYNDAADKVREIISHNNNPTKVDSILKTLLEQFKMRNIAATSLEQIELLQQVIIAEAKKDNIFKQYLLRTGSEIYQAMDDSLFSQAIKEAIVTLTAEELS